MEKIPQQPIKLQEKEKTSEELSVEQSRGDYVKSYTEYKKEFGQVKKKESDELEKKIEPARKFVERGKITGINEEAENIIKSVEKGGIPYTTPKLRKICEENGIDDETIKKNKPNKLIEILKSKKQPENEGENKKRFIKELTNKGVKEKQAEAIYNTELKKAEYDAAKVEAGKKMAEQGASQAEIFQKLFLQEREILNQKKVESWPPKEKGILRKGMEWYMKRGTVTRLLISTGLVTGAVASVGGFGAAAVASYAGYRFVRGFGSVMIGKLVGKGVDKILSRGIEAQKEASLEKLKSGFDLNKLKETEKELEKILEETAKRERRKALAVGLASAAAGMWTAVGMGMLEKSLAGGVKSNLSEHPPQKPKMAPIETESIPPKPAVENVVEVRTGDTVWKLAEKQLEERGYFKDLTGTADEITAKKNFLIDSISKKVNVPSGDANLIHAGEKIDFKNVFADESKIEQFVDKAEHLKPKAAAEGGSKVFDYFEHQSRPEKWRTIQIYQDDIDSMKRNMVKFEDPQVKASIQKEIDRLEGVKTSLIKKLAEQTEQTVPAKAVAGEAVKKVSESLAEGVLPKDKMTFLENLVYKDDHLVGFKVKVLVEQIKSDKLTAEDFSKYYASKIGAERVSDKILDGFKYNFKAIIEGRGVERLKAEGVMATLLKRLESIK